MALTSFVKKPTIPRNDSVCTLHRTPTMTLVFVMSNQPDLVRMQCLAVIMATEGFHLILADDCKLALTGRQVFNILA